MGEFKKELGEFRGTKGSWFVDGDVIVDEETDLIVVDVRPLGLEHSCVWEFSEKQLKANALLISKAPEMLEMFIDFVETYESGGVINNEYYIDKFKQLIKEATEL